MNSHKKRTLLGMASSGALAGAMALASPVGAVVVNNTLTPTQAIDTQNVTGVGQMVVDLKNGFIGLCTGTLINPRTVIFAAHCVNENPAGTGFQPGNGYGSKTGGLPIGFFFNVNNNAAGNSAIGQWLNGANGSAPYLTRTANNAYNANYVWYNPASTSLGLGGNFLQGDVALAALDTPAANVPTWTLLFSPLASAQHVTVTGYGANGVGTSGSTGAIDFRRRVAENMVSLLGSLDDQDLFLYGAKDGLPQNLYMIDFNDPKYGKPGASPFDFNIFNDAALPKEGTIGPGDSGGPLIVDQAYSKPIIIGVLSGSDTFFSKQPANSYGTTGFYQPLYLFWDLIVANNPYKYVGSLAGDAKWTDPSHWVINIDPNFVSLNSSGQLVNALPTSAGAGVTGTQPKFGSVCFRADCVKIATGVETVNGVPVNGLTASPAVVSTTSIAESLAGPSLTANGLVLSPSVVSIASIDETGASSSAPSQSSPSADTQVSAEEFAAYRDAALALASAPTAANGLPGATNFVPSDTDGTPGLNVPPRYYDVTLAAAGTTTLDVGITVDRLTLSGSSATLNVTTSGALTSLIDTTVNAGTLNVDGRYTSVGDIALIGGLLSGSGIVNTGHLTSVLGAIAPGGLSKIGALTVQGDVVLSSGSRLFINYGAGNSSSRLVSLANASQGTAGIVNLGGLLALNPISGYVPHYGDSYLVVSAQSAVTGGFNAVTAISQGVLYPKVVQTANSVSVQVQAASYSTVINSGSSVQANYAALLDGSRSAYNQLTDLYGPLDVAGPTVLQPILEAMAPFNATEMRELTKMSSDALSDLRRSRIEEDRGAYGTAGTLSVIGRPLQIAELDQRFHQPDDAITLTDAGGGAPVMVLPKGVNAFVAGGYLNGEGRNTPTLLGGKDSLDGYYLALGVEAAPTPAATLGISLGYVGSRASTLSISRVRERMADLAVYGVYRLKDGYFISGEASAATIRSSSDRTIAPLSMTLGGRSNGSGYTVETAIGRDMSLKSAPKLTITPIAGLRAQTYETGELNESGGGAALKIQNQSVDSLQGRVGANVKGAYAYKDMSIVPSFNAAYVHAFDNGDSGILASLAGGVTTPVVFAGPKLSRDWGELGGALTFKAKGFDVRLAANTNLGRKDLDFQTYSASVHVRF